MLKHAVYNAAGHPLPDTQQQTDEKPMQWKTTQCYNRKHASKTLYFIRRNDQLYKSYDPE
jgi:hypothetical protein